MYCTMCQEINRLDTVVEYFPSLRLWLDLAFVQQHNCSHAYILTLF